MKWIKVVLVNLLVFFCLLLAIEMAWRSVLTAKSCFGSKCNLKYLTKINIHDDKIGRFHLLFRFDEKLGHVQKEGFDSVIDDHDWVPNAKVTISADGYRLNNVDTPLSASDILAAGDSFTFGSQVSNDQTWPSCLERKLKRGVDNCGVAGYGGAQSLERALLIMKKKKYSSVILSILVGDDFNRDRLSYRYGFPKPSLIKENNKIKWSPVSDPNMPGTIFNLSKSLEVFYFFHKKSLLFCFIASEVLPNFSSSLQGLTEVHPDAASVEEIINFTLEKFSKIEIPFKVLLLQYRMNLNDSNVLAERELILKTARRLPIKVVDTYDYLKKYNHQKIWFARGGHHKPLGNTIVCDCLFEEAFKSTIDETDGQIPAAQPHSRQ